MQKIKFDNILHRLAKDYPNINFIESDESFSWNPTLRTIYYDKNDKFANQLLLHELGHAIKEHTEYTKDIELIKMEREAWMEAIQISQTYSTKINTDIVEDNLDSYRDWLQKKSTCPKCNSTGFQTKYNTYLCPVCKNSWKVNDGITCRIYRKIK